MRKIIQVVLVLITVGIVEAVGTTLLHVQYQNFGVLVAHTVLLMSGGAVILFAVQRIFGE